MQYLSQRLATESPETREASRAAGPVVTSQRQRILDATEALVAERGAAAATIEATVKGAGVSSVTFYEHFRDKEECLVAALDRAVEELRMELREAVPAGASGEERVRAGLAALLATLDARPERARLCFVEAQRGGPRMRARYDEVLDAAAAELDDPLGQAVAGGLAWLLRERLELGGGGSVQDLLPRMTEVVLVPPLSMADPARAAEDLAASKDRLPAGRHGLPREFVAENQRERLLNGVVEAVAEHGYNATTIGAITEAAKISRRTFYEHFRDKEGCFLAAYEMIDEHVRASMLGAPDPASPWPEQVEARLAALLDVLSRDLAVARFYLTEPLAAGGEIAARYRDAMQLLAKTLRPPAGPADLNAEIRDQALMGGIATLIARRLNAGESQHLLDLLPDLKALVLRPY